MPRTFIELQAKSETTDARLALWKFARKCIGVVEAKGLHAEFLDECFTSSTNEWSFLVIMVTGNEAYALITSLIKEQEATGTQLSVTIFDETDGIQTDVNQSEVTINYYRLDVPDSNMVFHTDCNVELIHTSTGITVRSQNSRSRSRNYENALSLLRCHLSLNKQQKK